MSSTQNESVPKYLYNLDIRVPNSVPQRLDILNQVTIGDSDEVDFPINNKSLSKRHCTFRAFNDILSITVLDKQGNTFIANQSLMPGKMYLIDKGDKVIIDDIEILIRRYSNTGKLDHTSTSISEVNLDKFKPTNSPNTPEKNDSGEMEFEMDNLTEHDVRLKSILDKASSHSIPEKDFDVVDDEDITVKKVNILSKLKGIFNKNVSEFEEDTVEKKISRYDTTSSEESIIIGPPGLLIKIYSFVTSIFIAYGLLTFLSEVPIIKDILSSITIPLSSFFSETIPQIGDINLVPYFELYITYSIVEVASSLLLGMSIPYFVIAIKNLSPKARSTSLVNSFVSIFTLPVIILNLPLKNNRSIVDNISKQVITITNQRFKVLGMIAVYPLLIVSGFFANIVMSSSTSPLEIFKVNIESMAPKKVKNPTYSAVSNDFRFSIKTKLPMDMSVIPEVEVSGTTINKVFSVFMKNKIVEFKAASPINIYNIIKKHHGDINFFSTSYPVVGRSFDSNEKGIKTGKMLELEMQQIVKDTLEFSIFNIFGFILDHGPFINGYISLRNDLIRELQIIPQSEITLTNYGNGNFLRVTTAKGPKVLEKLIPLTVKNFPSYELSFKSNAKVLNNKLRFTFFRNAKWNWDRKKSFQITEVSQEWNAFNVLEFSSLTNKNKIKFIKSNPYGYFMFYFNMAKKAYEMNNRPFSKKVKASIESSIKFMETLNTTESNDVIKEMIQNIKNIKIALVEKKENFF